MGKCDYEILRREKNMKLLSFTRLGKPGFGAFANNGVIDLTGRLDPEVNTIKDLITLNTVSYTHLTLPTTTIV